LSLCILADPLFQLLLRLHKHFQLASSEASTFPGSCFLSRHLQMFQDWPDPSSRSNDAPRQIGSLLIDSSACIEASRNSSANKDVILVVCYPWRHSGLGCRYLQHGVDVPSHVQVLSLPEHTGASGLEFPTSAVVRSSKILRCPSWP